MCKNGSQIGTTGNSQWYRGMTRDGSTGTYQMGTRTYDPKTGAFTAPDAYRVSSPSTDLSVGTDPLTANTYTYVNGNPLNYSDPDGHRAVDSSGNEVSPCVSNPSSCTAKGVASERAAYTRLLDRQAKANDKAAKKAARAALAENPPPDVDPCVFAGNCLSDLERISILQGMAGTDCKQTAAPTECLVHGGSEGVAGSSLSPKESLRLLYDFFIGSAIESCKNFSPACILAIATIVFKPLKGTRYVDDLGRLAARSRRTEEGVEAATAAVESWAANAGPRVWTNLAPKDPLFPGRTVPLDRLSSINGRFQYIVGQDGRLIVGRGGHIDLARGSGVTAAGEVRVVNGEVRMFNNASGHYQPDASIQGIAQTAFENAGLIIRNGAWQAVTH
ncbi:RHS repeat-associated core domain-containing protein [Pimelobacter simplex]|uniref:RHS repeat-associated core domain-containing protein n=1 Tax=Nocardioides simplex TaxID=2045 RepID=UPI0038169746